MCSCADGYSLNAGLCEKCPGSKYIVYLQMAAIILATLVGLALTLRFFVGQTRCVVFALALASCTELLASSLGPDSIR